MQPSEYFIKVIDVLDEKDCTNCFKMEHIGTNEVKLILIVFVFVHIYDNILYKYVFLYINVLPEDGLCKPQQVEGIATK
jgi:hypothetical protein